MITYRELRLLEIEVLKLLEKGQQHLNIQSLSLVDVDAFYGIEIDEWPARIAEVAMWLMDHQMNIRLSEEFGQYFVRLPLTKSPTIVSAMPCDGLEGDSPARRSAAMCWGIRRSWESNSWTRAKPGHGPGLSSYQGPWLAGLCHCMVREAASYIQGTRNSRRLCLHQQHHPGRAGRRSLGRFVRAGSQDPFCHRTFAWESEAKGKAHVHVVIIGFGACDFAPKRLYEYEAVSPARSSRLTRAAAARSLPRLRRRRTSALILWPGRIAFSRPGASRSVPCRRSFSAACRTTAAIC